MPYDIRLPIKYDAKRDEFTVSGQFCSWPCMKAYNTDSRRYLSGQLNNVLTLFRKRCCGILGPLRSAPPREMLRAFGGTMSLSEFRAASEGPTEFVPLPPRMISHEMAIAEQNASAIQNAAFLKTSQNLDAKIDFANVGTKNETLRLKRPKKSSSKSVPAGVSTITHSMGTGSASS
jgi:hypothetical protein